MTPTWNELFTIYNFANSGPSSYFNFPNLNNGYQAVSNTSLQDTNKFHFANFSQPDLILPVTECWSKTTEDTHLFYVLVVVLLSSKCPRGETMVREDNAGSNNIRYNLVYMDKCALICRVLIARLDLQAPLTGLPCLVILCAGLTLVKSWRVPNAKELQSIIDYSYQLTSS